jgi:hypothetical protein
VRTGGRALERSRELVRNVLGGRCLPATENGVPKKWAEMYCHRSLPDVFHWVKEKGHRLSTQRDVA